MIFAFGIWNAAQIGRSRSNSTFAKQWGLLSVADQAVRLSPSDPQAHYYRAQVLEDQGQLSEAVKEYEAAVALRPRYYMGWLRLGFVRNQMDDNEGALAAFREAVRYAPYYGQPRWYLGHVLLQLEKFDDGFAEMRRAVASDPGLLPIFIDLTWESYDGDADAVKEAIQPQTTAARTMLAEFFVKRGKIKQAMELFHEAGELADKERREFLEALMTAKQFPEAYEVWSKGRPASSGINSIINGGFEEPLALDNQGFGWQFATNLGDVSYYLDANTRRAGARSLRIDYNGRYMPASAGAVSQIILVEPNTQYRLNFAVRTQDISTLGLPSVSVRDDSEDETTIIRSAPFPAGTTDWRDYSVEFTTPDTARAVIIRLRREYYECPDADCPIYGHVWLDGFSLQKL